MDNLKKGELIKIGEAAKILGVSQKTLRRWEKKGKILSVRTPGGTRYYKREDIEKLLNNYSISPSKILNYKKILIGGFLVIIFLVSFYFAFSKTFPGKKLSASLKSFLDSAFKLSSKKEEFSLLTVKEKEEEEINVPSLSKEKGFLEGELEINAPVKINGSLNIKEKLNIEKGSFKGSFKIENLTGDREYILPDLSGTVCLDTGNCVGIGGEVITEGGIFDRLAKFVSPNKIGISSILDLFKKGIALKIDEEGKVGIGTETPKAKLEVLGSFLTPNLFVEGKEDGKVGIGTESPEHKLHVIGRIQATGDICTDLKGGKCLSELTKQQVVFLGGGGGGGISGTGTTNYIPLWSGSETLSNSILYQSGNYIGLGTTSPTTELEVAGTVKMTGFQLTTGAQAGYVLVSDANGVGSWQALPSGNLPPATSGQTLRHDGTNWVADSFLYNTGSQIGIGVTSNLPAILTVYGDGTIPQFYLKYDDQNYLKFLISDSSSTIEASKNIIINSLTGEVKMGTDVTTFDASSATVKGATFISGANDATVRKSDELILREVIPIFRFSIPVQTTSTSYVRVSKYIEDLSSVSVSQISGTDRKYAFLINFADDINLNQTSDWRVYRPNTGTEYLTFTFSGQNMSSLTEGKPHLTNILDLPSTDWQLEVKIPSGKKIRIFNILLLVFDKVQ